MFTPAKGKMVFQNCSAHLAKLLPGGIAWMQNGECVTCLKLVALAPEVIFLCDATGFAERLATALSAQGVVKYVI